jgi:hypothetical protein
MFIDSSLLMADAVSVAGAAGTALIGSQIDTSVAGTLDGTNIGLVIIATTGIITGGSAGTIKFQLASDTTAAISTTTSAVLYQTPDYVTGSATLPAGTVLFSCALPRVAGHAIANRRYLGILAVIGTTTVTAGAIRAFLTEDIGRYMANVVATN